MAIGKMNRRAFIRLSGAGMTGLALSAAGTAGKPLPRKPNIIVILVDDLGWAELGCYGNAFNETPNLDALAEKGIRFSEAYAAAPVCSPTRASFLTGLYPARIGITDYLRPDDTKHLPADCVTVAEALKKSGYATGIVGKWHLSGYANHGAKEFPPGLFGFDETIVSENRGIGNGSYFYPYQFNREIRKRLPDREYLIDRCNLEAVDFIERHRREPFFLFLSYYAVHTRLQGKNEWVLKYERKPESGKGESAGRNNPHLAALRTFGLDQNTLLMFAGDNGGESRVTSNAPLRKGKSCLYEGGIRVPLIVHWPGRVKAGSVCPCPVSSIDWFPTLLQAAGIPPDPNSSVDGLSLLPLLKDPAARLARETLFWYYPLDKPHFLGGRSAGAVRQGNWKLIRFYDTQETELYHLKQDIGETTNLAVKLPDKAKQLEHALVKWLQAVQADPMQKAK